MRLRKIIIRIELADADGEPIPGSGLPIVVPVKTRAGAADQMAAAYAVAQTVSRAYIGCIVHVFLVKFLGHPRRSPHTEKRLEKFRTEWYKIYCYTWFRGGAAKVAYSNFPSSLSRAIQRRVDAQTRHITGK